MILCIEHNGIPYFAIGDMVVEGDTYMFATSGVFEYHVGCMDMSLENYLDEHYLSQEDSLLIMHNCSDQVIKLLQEYVDK